MTNCRITWKSSARYPASLGREPCVMCLVFQSWEIPGRGAALSDEFDEPVDVILRGGETRHQPEHGFFRADQMGCRARR